MHLLGSKEINKQMPNISPKIVLSPKKQLLANLAPGRLATLSACCGFAPAGFLDLGMFSSQVAHRLRMAWKFTNGSLGEISWMIFI